jgi:hypothetical protein
MKFILHGTIVLFVLVSLNSVMEPITAVCVVFGTLCTVVIIAGFVRSDSGYQTTPVALNHSPDNRKEYEVRFAGSSGRSVSTKHTGSARRSAHRQAIKRSSYALESHTPAIQGEFIPRVVKH